MGHRKLKRKKIRCMDILLQTCGKYVANRASDRQAEYRPTTRHSPFILTASLRQENRKTHAGGVGIYSADINVTPLNHSVSRRTSPNPRKTQKRDTGQF